MTQDLCPTHLSCYTLSNKLTGPKMICCNVKTSGANEELAYMDVFEQAWDSDFFKTIQLNRVDSHPPTPQHVS